MNMNEDQHHDSERAKLRASLNWLIAKAFCDKIPTVYSDLFLEDAKGHWHLKPQVVRALTSGELYCAACTHLFADKEAAWTDHALVLSHLWQRRGVRAVERGGHPVVEAVLKKDSPFYTPAHLGLVDAIMRAYVAQLVDLPGVMREIGRCYPFPGPETPPAVSDGLELWLGSVAETLLERRVPLRDADQRQSKVRRLVAEMRFPTRLACLLRFYCSVGKEGGDLIGSSALQDLSAVEAHCDLVIDHCRRLRPTTILHLDRHQLAKASTDQSSLLRPNLHCLLAELFVQLQPPPTERRASLQHEMPNFHLSTRLNTRTGSPGPSSGVFRLRDNDAASDDGRRPRGNSLPPQEAQLGALFHQSQRQSSPRPSGFAEPLMPAALRPSKERLTPEVSKAVESGETNGAESTGFRPRHDPKSPLSTGTYRLPKSRSRDFRGNAGSDDEFTTPSEEPGVGSLPDAKVTFAQFLTAQKKDKDEALPPLPPAAAPPRSLKEEFERKRKERGGGGGGSQGQSPAPTKRTTFAPLPNQTTWAAQQRRRQSESGSLDGRESGGESERGSSSSLHLLPNFTDTKIRIEQKKRQIKADLKRADAKLRQMREEENKRIFQQLCMQKETKNNADEEKEEKKEKEEEKEEAVEKDREQEKEEEVKEKEPSAEVVRLTGEVEAMRKEKEGLKELLMQLQRQQDTFQQQQTAQLAQMQARHREVQAQAEEQLRQQRQEQERERQRLQLEQELALARAHQQAQALELERERQRLQQAQMEREMEMELERDRLRQSLAAQTVPTVQTVQTVQPAQTTPPAPPRSESPVPSEGGLSGSSQPDYSHLYDRFNQSLNDLQQDISKLSLQQEFMNQTIKERLEQPPPPTEPPEMATRAAWATPGWPAPMMNGGLPIREPTPPPPPAPAEQTPVRAATPPPPPTPLSPPAALPTQPAPPAQEDEASPAAFFVSFGGEEDKKPTAEKPRRKPKKSADSSSTTSTESAVAKTPKPAAPPPKPEVAAPPVPPAAVPAASAFVLDENKGKKEELSKRQERFVALQKRRLAEREAERQEKWEQERERERVQREKEKEAQEARKAREREKRDRVFQTYLERKALDDEEDKAPPARRPRPVRPPTHSPAPVAARSRLPAAPNPSGALRRTASAHAPPSPSPLALDLPGDDAGATYEYRGIGPATVRLSSTTHSRPSTASSREPPAAAAAAREPAEYNGPRLFKQPKERSNRSVIVNAINHCLLPGVVNKEVRTGVLQDLQNANGSTFMVLFRNRSCQYRGLYSFHQEAEDLTRFAGSGPKKVRNSDVVDFFKYDSGAKKFSLIDTTKHLSPVIDAFTIDNRLWKKSGTRPSGQVAAAPQPASTTGYATRRH